MRNLIMLLILFTFNKIISQEKVVMKEVYIEDNLVYKLSTDELFTGIAEHRKKNGKLTYEEEYNNGVIISSNLYYRGKESRVSDKIIYNPNSPFRISKEIRYHSNGEIYRIKTYNENGIKILTEEFENSKLTYSCQYLGKKKHGIKLCYDENGEILIYSCEFINGKKHGTEYCLNDDGTETKKEYRNGKKIK